MSVNTFSSNRLRSSLSLLGITIGIFAIVSVFTLVDSLELNIRESVSSLGDDVLYIEKWPWGPEEGEDEYPWWKYMNRPVPEVRESEYISKNSQFAMASAFIASSNRTVKFENNSVENIEIMGVSPGFERVRSMEIQRGRYFNTFEAEAGRNIAVLGGKLAEELFEGADPIGKEIIVSGYKVVVVGVKANEGTGVFGEDQDEMVLVPLNFLKNFVNIRREWNDPAIWVRAKPTVNVTELKYEVEQLLRAYRRLKPLEENDFAMNQASLINRQLDRVFKVINIAGFFIGIFSILVGGFGIANIMFVTVKERTRIIGIQKAVGAKRYFILLQFLFESVMLSLAGGIIGLLIIGLGTLLINLTGDFRMYLTLGNILFGIVISSLIGLLSGFAPAWQAARMNPVTAINTAF
jgi:putative ABC transport system permease protein